MSEIRTGLRGLLRGPRLYDALSRLVGEHRVKTELVTRYARVSRGDRVLDIGCGTGRTLAYLPEVDYLGFDPSAAYIEAARRSYGDRGTFVCAGVHDVRLEDFPRADVALAVAVLHHLDDDAASRLFQLASSRLVPGGRLVTLDAVIAPAQSRVARFLIDRDRGRNVRTEDGYAALARRVFPHVQSAVRHDMLRVPYTHVILTCRP